MLQMWADLVERIGTERLLNLPPLVKECLMDCYDLEIKVQMLQLIATQLGV